MNMVAHDHIAKKYIAFVFDTEIKTFDHFVPVSFSGKNINPVNNSAGNKVRFFLISDDVAGFHGLCFIKDNDFLKGSKSGDFAQRVFITKG